MMLSDTVLFYDTQRVAGLLDSEAAARWERLELDQSLARMPDVVHCPRCATPCIEDGGDHCAQCPQCLFAFCTLCNDSWHGRSIQARARGTLHTSGGCPHKEVESVHQRRPLHFRPDAPRNGGAHNQRPDKDADPCSTHCSLLCNAWQQALRVAPQEHVGILCMWKGM